MPGASRTQRAEAKYNVVLDFPDYGLHSAALSGNLGLVKYALDHGQPVNSALDGVLPLHAACSGGNDLVVRLLIEHGADVNAPRIPRRYSNDRHRGTSAPLSIAGASGSTPLHFAAAHGHTNLVLTLLLHGAHPDRPDKHGITPEMLARQNGFTASADVLREWCHNKDKDLREREAIGSYYPEDQTFREKESHPYCGSLDCKECATRKRIRMKRSIDNAIHILRHSSSHSSNLATPPHSAGPLPSNEPPSPLGGPLGEYTYYNSPDSTVIEEDLPPRRPSLPHVLEVPNHAVPTSHRSRRPSNLSTASTHRPRSAGNDAEPSASRVKGKISLLNIFKKGNDTPDSVSSYNSSPSSAVTSASTSPAPGGLSALAMTSLRSRSTDMLALADPSPSNTQSSLHQRLFRSGDNAASSVTPPAVQAAELHHALSRESLLAQATLPTGTGETRGSGNKSSSHSPIRAGILRAHGRSASGGPPPDGGGGGGSVGNRVAASGSGRSLRFDATTASPARRSESQPRSHAHAHNLSGDSHSRGASSGLSRSPGSAAAASWGLRVESEPEPFLFTTSPAPMHQEPGKEKWGENCDIEEEDEDEDDEREGDEEEEYGNPVEPQVGIGELKSRLSDIQLREKNASADTKMPDAQKHEHIFECPFSINCPPPVEEPTPTAPTLVTPSTSLDTRTRGDSLSSMATDTSGGPPSSYVPTPALEQCSLPVPMIASPSSTPTDLPQTIDITTPEKKPRNVEAETPLSSRRAHAPLDIDITNISSHAQAEALVQLAQQRIFDLDNDDDEFDDAERKSFGLGEGHTPLSARLAAYGESLAIERRFKAREDKRKSLVSQGSSSESSTLNVHMMGSVNSHGAYLNRQLSLQEKSGARSVSDVEEQRPHTSGGTPASGSGDVFLSADRSGSRSNIVSISNPENSSRLHGAVLLSSSTSLISPPSAHIKTRSETLPVLRPTIPLVRSRTPDPDTTLSYGGSFGAPLARFPTCPAEDTLHELVPRKASLSTQARQAARAQKLAKMGFSSGGDTWRESSGLSRSQKPRFGGIKTLVQSLTGRT